jgi:hypothetical protein
MLPSQKDIEILRELAVRYAGHASLPVQSQKREFWRSMNNGKMIKPMIAIDQMPWNELDVDGFLICKVEDPYWHWVEWNLRMEIYKWEHLPADMVLNPYILIPRHIGSTGYGIAPKDHTSVTDPSSAVLGHYYEAVIEEPEDVEKIQIPQISVDRDADKAVSEVADYIFAGIIPWKFSGWTFHLGLWDFLSQWLGVENCYIELMDRPEFMHACMERLTVAMISQIEQGNKLGIFDVTTNITHCSYTFSDFLPPADCNLDAPQSKDVWAFGLAQLFSSASPDITAEFEVPYMQRLFPYFGAVYYGCCDRLDDRLDIVDRMPKIRKVSCSPWSKREAFAEKLPAKYIMSNKPSPAILATDVFDEDAARADIRRTIDAAKQYGKRVELILKDISTVRYDPRRLWRWSEIAVEETLR